MKKRHHYWSPLILRQIKFKHLLRKLKLAPSDLHIFVNFSELSTFSRKTHCTPHFKSTWRGRDGKRPKMSPVFWPHSYTVAKRIHAGRTQTCPHPLPRRFLVQQHFIYLWGGSWQPQFTYNYWLPTDLCWFTLLW